jgi:hypothetical protein
MKRSMFLKTPKAMKYHASLFTNKKINKVLMNPYGFHTTFKKQIIYV